MSPSDCSHINIQTIHFGVVEIELLPTEFPWCTAHTAIAEEPVQFREEILQNSQSQSKIWEQELRRMIVLIPYSFRRFVAMD